MMRHGIRTRGSAPFVVAALALPGSLATFDPLASQDGRVVARETVQHGPEGADHPINEFPAGFVAS
jgi:hypothetical protein